MKTKHCKIQSTQPTETVESGSGDLFGSGLGLAERPPPDETPQPPLVCPHLRVVRFAALVHVAQYTTSFLVRLHRRGFTWRDSPAPSGLVASVVSSHHPEYYSYFINFSFMFVSKKINYNKHKTSLALTFNIMYIGCVADIKLILSCVN